MIAMNERLIAAGHAYVAEGHVLYDVSSKPDYGKLARRSLDEMLAGARVEVAPYKKNPMDFVLWKPSTQDQPGWDSPWGRGRPGWHIECSAMSEALLGETFDIHGGGIDLVFPHHENEIAQSEGAHHGHPLAKLWMHNGFLQVEGEKMSKSLGNFVTIRELLHTEKFGGMPWSGDAVRLAMLMTHYRQPIDWTVDRLATAGANLWTFNFVGAKGLRIPPTSDISAIPEIVNGQVSDGLLRELSDDMNTPSAILSHLFSLVKEADKLGGISEQPATQLLIDCLFLGIDPFRFVRDQQSRMNTGEIDMLITARNAARMEKNFKESDRIRDELLAKGIVLKDSPTGTTWEVKR
jgi:cysteinyl-tRNA synthetase